MSSRIVIEASGLYKLYRLGAMSSGAFKKDLSRWWTVNVMGKEDPFGKINEDGSTETNEQQFMWALQNVSFNVKEGEVLGIIGKNGAGKSTLLKILSRVTRPTKGVVRGKGHIASLLEVGTGFHEELTGRENIYLNGNIMGMTKKDVDKRLDEIVNFSGIERYIDTPVKRYSSGMYVRLAFAVAAHLNADILIIDEALSVGDADFQRKCLNKIREISVKAGKTIILVSHTMHTVQSFCHRAILLQKGSIIEEGLPDHVVHKYLHAIQAKDYFNEYADDDVLAGDADIRVKKVTLDTGSVGDVESINVNTTLYIRFECKSVNPEMDLAVGMYLFSVEGECIFNALSNSIKTSEGTIQGCCIIPGKLLNDGSYFVSLAFIKNGSTDDIFYLEECLTFDVEDVPGQLRWYGNYSGHIRPALSFSLTEKKSLIVT
ncbi:ABC transporter ATP-binding protein [Danxiaibacter flavus]|uniref:ABC transporter ATP-binding protein n=1 Tax=Danxiaibacter flavus TaxID=3049108 RepID=A0ABV3ZIF1_9BACT|nr:ABC transporter ATP-binding protein [Chitinophagaceae bacterium DXS]